MRPHEVSRAKHLEKALVQVHKCTVPLDGIRDKKSRDVFILQLIDSFRRVEFFQAIQARGVSPARLNPLSNTFDPIRGSILERNAGNIDNAFWLIFLATHFGRHDKLGWQLTREIYAGDGINHWDWNAITSQLPNFEKWLQAYLTGLKAQNKKRSFSNHRKYESLSKTTDVISSYIDWVSPYGGHNGLLQHSAQQVGQNPNSIFEFLYNEMDQVSRFGRLGKFDFLTTIGKLNLGPMTPGLAYFKGATGPSVGAKLLFFNDEKYIANASLLESKTQLLSQSFGEPFIMQILEDSMCNWQKSPRRYIQFR